ncbi:MAG: hypothetical protein ABWZ86_06680 [Hyphomicrobium sp.]
MHPTRAYVPEALDRMTLVLERAIRDLDLAEATSAEKERLAACILSVGNSSDDVESLVDSSVALYLRSIVEPRRFKARSFAAVHVL